MKWPLAQKRLFLVTNGSVTPAQLEAILTSIPLGTAAVEVCEPQLSARDLASLCRQLHVTARERRCPILVHDRIDVALSAGADGVMLPEYGLGIADARRLARTGEFLVGVEAHSADGAGAAARDGADLVLVGPVFASATPGAPLLGADGLHRARKAISEVRPDTVLFAAGGVDTEDRAAAAIRAGAAGVAVDSLWSTPEAATELWHAANEA